jgi:hypothetical protein
MTTLIGAYFRIQDATPLVLAVAGLVLALVLLAPAWKVLVRYVIVPLRRRHETYPMRRWQVPLDLTQVPEDVAAAFHGTCAQLASHGFTAAGHFQTHREGTRVSTWGYVSVWTGPDGATTAQVLGVIADAARGVRVCRTSVVLRSDFADGREITSSNVQAAGVYPPDPKRDSVRWPAMQDFATLWRLHAARLKRVADRPLPPPARDRAADYLVELERRVMQGAVDHGYLRPDPAAQVYRQTLKGTFLMIWRILRPWRGITERRTARKRAAVLREVGMDGGENAGG